MWIIFFQAKDQEDTSLFMECVEEELSEAQKNFFFKRQEEFKVSFSSPTTTGILQIILVLAIAKILYRSYEVFLSHVKAVHFQF
jgi:hypothetical protein